MTTNKPEVVAWYTPPTKNTLPVVALNDRSKRGEPLIRLSDYEALEAKKAALAGLHTLNRLLADALDGAARSLGTISRQAGIDEYMCDFLEVRGYARNRALVAVEALAAYRKQGGDT